MNIESIRGICLKFPGVTEDIKWECHLCFNVGGKMFLITSPDDVPVRASFKVSEEDFEALTEREGFGQAAHLAKRKWISVADVSLLDKREWHTHLRRSYDLVFAGLTKKMQAQINSVT